MDRKTELLTRLEARYVDRPVAQLINLRARMAEDAYPRAKARYDQAWEQHKAVLQRFEAQVLAELRAENGPHWGFSWGGRMIVHHRASERYIGYLSSLGYERPVNPGRQIVSGRDKDTDVDPD